MEAGFYQKEQIDTHLLVASHLDYISREEKKSLFVLIEDYFEFRKKVAFFLERNFKDICTKKCYESSLSACCQKEGIVIFFADFVVNAILSKKEDINKLVSMLHIENKGDRCIYLGEYGCMWVVKPIVCEMFLCNQAKKKIFESDYKIKEKWNEFKKCQKLFTWPDRPVLFDELENYFIKAGLFSPLMYMHNSPGLLRVKKNGLKSKKIKHRIIKTLST